MGKKFMMHAVVNAFFVVVTLIWLVSCALAVEYEPMECHEEDSQGAYYTMQEVECMAKMMYGECCGMSSEEEIAKVGWWILNRVEKGWGSIEEVIKAPYQTAYDVDFPTVNQCGIDLMELAEDVIYRWTLGERLYSTDILYWGGDGQLNYGRTSY